MYTRTKKKKKIILRRYEQCTDDAGICGNNGGDAFDTDSQHVYNLQIYYTKLIHSKVYYCSRGFFSHLIFIYMMMIMVCTCEKGDAQNHSRALCVCLTECSLLKFKWRVCVCHHHSVLYMCGG